MTSDSTILFSEVKKLGDAQILRDIRNECREYMTRNTKYISEEEQEIWFANLDKSSIKIFLMFECYHGTVMDPVGFGYCRKEINEVYLTGGIKDQFRGKGYGRKLFTHLRDTAKMFELPIRLEVLNTNMRAENLYKSLGFVEISKNDIITKMECRE